MNDTPPPLPPGQGQPASVPMGDPTAVPTVRQQVRAAQAAPGGRHGFPCPTCGANLHYRPGSNDLACAHCGAVVPIRNATACSDANQELDYRSADEGHLPAEAMHEIRTAHCPNCGADVEFAEAEQATRCPFCATPVVLDPSPHRQIRPRGVLPFAIDEATARRNLNEWLGHLWFAPNGVQEYARSGRAMDGIYIPYWTFDAETTTDYVGERGIARYREHNGKTVRDVIWTRCRGTVSRVFDDILVVASRALPKRYVDRLEPWDLQDLRDYRPEFVAGFRAESYTIDLSAGMKEARMIMDQQITRDIYADIGGDEQRILSADTAFGAVTFKHLLLPIYLAAYKYRGTSYRLVVNGRTGEVQGERPWSGWKIAFAVILGLIALGVAFYLKQTYFPD